MPRVGDLSKCKIYKITSLNNPELVYYGHTCQALSSRFAKHKTSSNTTTSKIVIEKGDAVILLVEDYPCESKDIARAREAYYILNNDCVNKRIPGRTKEESYKVYRTSHREQIFQRKKIYNESHKEEKKEYDRQNHLKKKEYDRQNNLKKKTKKKVKLLMILKQKNRKRI